MLVTGEAHIREGWAELKFVVQFQKMSLKESDHLLE